MDQTPQEKVYGCTIISENTCTLQFGNEVETRQKYVYTFAITECIMGDTCSTRIIITYTIPNNSIVDGPCFFRAYSFPTQVRKIDIIGDFVIGNVIGISGRSCRIYDRGVQSVR